MISIRGIKKDLKLLDLRDMEICLEYFLRTAVLAARTGQCNQVKSILKTFYQVNSVALTLNADISNKINAEERLHELVSFNKLELPNHPVQCPCLNWRVYSELERLIERGTDA